MTDVKSPNYSSFKHEELYKLIDKYELDKADYMTKSEATGNENLNVKKLTNILKLIDAAAGKGADSGTVSDADGTRDFDPKNKLHKGLSGMMCECTFYSSDENDLPYVQMALNGIALLIKREVKAWVPKEFIDGVLQNAIATKMKMVTDRDGVHYIPKQVPRFPYTVHEVKHIDVLRKEYDEANKKETK